MKRSFLTLIEVVMLLAIARSVPAATIVYGTERGYNGGDIFEINLDTGIATKLYEQDLNSNQQNYPNGNAFDIVNRRLYYATSDRKLYFYSFDDNTRHEAGVLAGSDYVASATFHDSKYYYICQRSDDLRVVTFNADGTVSLHLLIAPNFTNSSKNFEFGDIGVDSVGVLYGSAAPSTGGSEFFKIDLSDNTYSTISTTLPHLQLAFAGDGTLYAHNANSGNFYFVNPTDGMPTLIEWDGRQTVIGGKSVKFTF